MDAITAAVWSDDLEYERMLRKGKRKALPELWHPEDADLHRVLPLPYVGDARLRPLHYLEAEA
jgi:hypothetical protein